MNALGLLGSGALLFTAAPSAAEEACQRIRNTGIPSAVIGNITRPGEGVQVEHAGTRSPLVFSEQDEIIRLPVSSPRSSLR
jgi:hydrogenase maturation factor